MTDEEFERLVEAGFDAIPAKFRALIRNVVIKIEDDVSEDVRTEMGLSKDESLLGLYSGQPLTERGVEYGVGITLPDTVTLFRLPIIAEAGNDPERIKVVVAETIWHEFAHYFGMSEEEVLARESKRDTPHSS